MTGRPDWVDDDLFPFESRFIDIDGHTLHYVDEGVTKGSGRTLLFLHGNPTWSIDYTEIITALASDFRCVAVDYAGFGLSTAAPGFTYLPRDHADVIGRFVDALELDGITLIGHDWGGPIGLSVVQSRPALFDRLVLTNTWAWPVDALPVKVMSHTMGSPLGRMLIEQLNFFVNVMIPLGHQLRKPTAAQMTHYRKALSGPGRRRGAAVFPREITGSRAFLADVEAGTPVIASLPTLILWGDADFAFGDADLRRWQQSFPNHETVIIKGAGHFVPSDAPEQFADAMHAWLSRVSPGT